MEATASITTTHSSFSHIRPWLSICDPISWFLPNGILMGSVVFCRTHSLPILQNPMLYNLACENPSKVPNLVIVI